MKRYTMRKARLDLLAGGNIIVDVEEDASGQWVRLSDAQAALAAKDAELAKAHKAVRDAEQGNRSLRRDMGSAVSWWAGRFREWLDVAQRQRDAGKPYSPTEARAAIEELLGDKGREYFDIQWKFKRDCEAAEKGNRRLNKELAAKDAALAECVAAMESVVDSVLLMAAAIDMCDSCIPRAEAEKNAEEHVTVVRLREAIAKYRPKEGADNAR